MIPFVVLWIIKSFDSDSGISWILPTSIKQQQAKLLTCQLINLFNSVAQFCPTFCNPMDCNTPGYPVHHQLPELVQTRTLSQWCHPTISYSVIPFSVIPFSSCLQSFPASRSFPMSQFFTSGGQSTGASVSASVLPMNIQCWFPLGLTGWISLQSKGLSRVFSNTTVQKHQFFGAQLSL